MTPGNICGFEWIISGRSTRVLDGKPHRCALPKNHAAAHQCDCLAVKYAGPDPTAWRKRKGALNGYVAVVSQEQSDAVCDLMNLQPSQRRKTE